MKKITFLIFTSLLFFQCSNEPSAPKPDVEYNIDGVRILIPRKYQKVSSEAELKKITVNEDSLIYVDQFLFKRHSIKNPNTHWFIKDDGKHLNYIVLQTDGPPSRLTAENEEYFREQFEKALEDNFSKKDSTYYFSIIESKISAAHRVKYLKLKYFNHGKGTDWYMTNYLIYSNNRTIGMSIISPHEHHLDLEKHMNFIKINKR